MEEGEAIEMGEMGEEVLWGVGGGGAVGVRGGGRQSGQEREKGDSAQGGGTEEKKGGTTRHVASGSEKGVRTSGTGSIFPFIYKRKGSLDYWSRLLPGPRHMACFNWLLSFLFSFFFFSFPLCLRALTLFPFLPHRLPFPISPPPHSIPSILLPGKNI